MVGWEVSLKSLFHSEGNLCGTPNIKTFKTDEKIPVTLRSRRQKAMTLEISNG